MLRPKLAVPPTLPVRHDHAPACTCQHPAAPVPTATTGQETKPYVAMGVGVAAGVLVVGVVLTALLVAVAVAAVSVALAAVVLRSLLTKSNTR